MRKAKKGLAMILALSMVSAIGLTGCANTASSSSTVSGSSTAAKGKVTLSFLSWTNETTMKPIITAFEKKYPNIKIDFQFAAAVNPYVQKFQILASSKAIPDVFVTAAETKSQVMTNNLAKDISSLPNVSNLSTANKKTYTDTNGKLIAFAPDGWYAGIMCNKDVLKANGLSVPTKYSEYIAVMKALKNKGVTPWAFCKDNLYDPLQGYVETETIAKDADYDTKVDSGKLTYTDGWKTPVQLWYNDYVKTGYASKTAMGLTGDQATALFAKGKAAFMVGATWIPAALTKLNTKLDYVLLPWFGTDDTTTYLTGACGVGWSISATTKHPEEANTFMEYLTSNEGLKIYQKQTSAVMAVKGVDSNIPAQIKDCYSYFQDGKIYLPAVTWKYSDALGVVLTKDSQSIISGAISDPQQMVTDMNNKWKSMASTSK